MPGRRLLGRLPEPVKRGLRPLRNLATGEGRTEGIRLAALERMRSTLATERVFWRDDAERLATKLARADAVLPIGQALDLGNDRPLRVAVLRHDTDRDIEASVRLAEWEAGEGLRSTYFVLHTDWYWGSEGPRRPSAFVLRALDRIAALGHEIGVHNNAIAESLRTGHPPEVILGEVLAALRGHGFEVRGTASHGDPLARQLGFVNFELFEGCPNPAGLAVGRALVAPDHPSGRRRELVIRPVPMASLGLDYEAYFIGQTDYISEAGGTWNVPLEELEDRLSVDGALVEVLTHPVYWDVSRPQPADPTVGRSTIG